MSMPHVSLNPRRRAGKFVLCPAVLILLPAALIFRPTESAHGRASSPVSLTGAAARAYLEGQGLDARLAQRAKLTATDGAANDQLGSAVAVSGETAVVGAPGADGPVCSETQGPIADQGAAYTFGCGFVEQQMLSPGAASLGDQIGLAVSIDGDTILVGAPQFSTGKTGLSFIFQNYCPAPLPPLSSVSAASYAAARLAPESMAAGFGGAIGGHHSGGGLTAAADRTRGRREGRQPGARQHPLALAPGRSML
jgi:hypothetical protein